MKTNWRTLWQQQAIVVYRDEVEVDRLAAERIGRVFLVYRGAGDCPGDIDMSIVELDGPGAGFALFEARTGFAGRVNFERQAFWQERACVYWVPAASAALPWRLRLGGWRSEAAARAYRRIERAELDGCVGGWHLEGPQTWEERKQCRLERSRPFGLASAWRAAA
jgi:hypothetical protein